MASVRLVTGQDLEVQQSMDEILELMIITDLIKLTTSHDRFVVNRRHIVWVNEERDDAE